MNFELSGSVMLLRTQQNYGWPSGHIEPTAVRQYPRLLYPSSLILADGAEVVCY
jgi:hypothetical protein